MAECRGETGAVRLSGHGRRERKQSFRIQNLLLKKINQQAV